MSLPHVLAFLVACCTFGCSDRGIRATGSDAPRFLQDGPPLSLADGAADDIFGFAVALSGSSALVGVPRRQVGANREQGAAYVWVKDGEHWRMQGSALVSDDGALGDHFGLSVALSGDTALIGAPAHTVNQSPFQGAAYVFVRSGETWVQQGSALSADDGAAADAFGTAVALTATDGAGNAIVGAPYHDVDGHSDQGAAYLFTRTGADWSQRADTLVANNGLAGEVFGSAVAIAGNTALVGAPVHQVGANPYQGGVYVFIDDGSAWTQQGPELTASDGGPFDQLSACAIVGDLALVGAPLHVVDDHPLRGAAYLFARRDAAWQQQAELIAGDGTDSAEFGSALALSASAALLAAPGRPGMAASSSGGVYFFAPDERGVWQQRGAVWSTDDGAAHEVFGSALALSGNIALVGAAYHQVGDNPAQGAVYTFAGSGPD